MVTIGTPCARSSAVTLASMAWMSVGGRYMRGGQEGGSDRPAHVDRAGQRVVIIRRTYGKAQSRIQAAGVRHPVERVELEFAVADVPRLAQQGLHERPAKS